MFYLSGVGLALFLGVLLLSKRPKNLADKILACWLFIITLHLAMFAFFRMKWYPVVLGIDLPLALLHGPLLYLYTFALTRNSIPLRTYALHLAVPASFYIYLIPFISLPLDQKIFVYEHEGIGYETFLAISNVCVPLSGVVYVILSSLALVRHRRSIVEEFSSTEKINLLWLQYLIIWIGAIWVLVLFGNDDWIFGATVIFVFFIGYFGIRQVGIFGLPQVHKEVTSQAPQPAVADDINTNSEEEPQKAKYQKSGLTEDGSETLHRQLTLLMNEEKLYCESELSLADLAKRLDTQPNYLSQVINEREAKNFYDYINTLRIQEFTHVASKPESRKLTLYALAQQCGFNSKSSFNRYFKKVTGQSPSEYLQKLSQQ